MASLALKNSRLISQLGRTACIQASSSFSTTVQPAQLIQSPVSKPKGRTTCTLIPGDGVGPELIDSVIEVFKAAQIPIDFERLFLSEVHAEASASLEEVATSISRNGICLKGILTTPDYSRTGDLQTLNMKLRKRLDLYAHVVHVKSLPGSSKHQNVDTIIIREQTEGEYSALEHTTVKGVVECLKVVTRKNSERIAKFAFDYATKHNRKKVTAVHKANIMKLGDGLFLKSCQEVAKLYPKIEFESMIVDNCTMQFVSHARQFDVCVMPNLYGNIITNLAAGLVGGAGLVAGASYSHKCVLFEQGARHTYGEAVGKNVANPTAMLLASANLCNHVNLQYYGDMLRNAVEMVLKAGKVRTKDLGGQATTQQFTRAVIHNLERY